MVRDMLEITMDSYGEEAKFKKKGKSWFDLKSQNYNH